MPAALKKLTLDELYRHLRDLDCRETATEAVLMVGYTSDGISNQEQTRWLSWKIDGGLRNTTEYRAGEFSLTTRPTRRTGPSKAAKHCP